MEVLKISKFKILCLLGGIFCFFISCASQKDSLECLISEDYQLLQWYLDDPDAGVGRVNQGSKIGTNDNVAIVSDGIDTRHCELKDSIETTLGFNYYTKLIHPLLSDDHIKRGSFMSGLLVAKSDGRGITGIVPNSKIVFFNLIPNFNGPNLVEAMQRNANQYGVSLNSWTAVSGFPQIQDKAEGELVFNPSAEPIDSSYLIRWENAINNMQGIGDSNLNPLGINYIFAAGDKGLANSNNLAVLDSNINAFTNFHGVIAVCSVNSDAKIADYSATGSNLMVCGPSVGRASQKSVVSTDVLGDGGYSATSKLGSTSATSSTTSTTSLTDDFTDRYDLVQPGDISSAIVAGVASLLRTTGQNFSWRDVRLILAETARMIDPSDDSWVDNKNLKLSDDTNNYFHSEKYGFGLADAKAAMTVAQNWVPVSTYYYTSPIQNDISDATTTIYGKSYPIDVVAGDVIPFFDNPINIPPSLALTKIEFVEIIVESNSLGDLDNTVIELESPNNVVSTLISSELAYELKANQQQFPIRWRFGSIRDLGADPLGTWVLHLKSSNTPKLARWYIKFYGRSG